MLFASLITGAVITEIILTGPYGKAGGRSVQARISGSSAITIIVASMVLGMNILVDTYAIVILDQVQKS